MHEEQIWKISENFFVLIFSKFCTLPSSVYATMFIASCCPLLSLFQDCKGSWQSEKWPSLLCQSYLVTLTKPKHTWQTNPPKIRAQDLEIDPWLLWGTGRWTHFPTINSTNQIDHFNTPKKALISPNRTVPVPVLLAAAPRLRNLGLSHYLQLYSGLFLEFCQRCTQTPTGDKHLSQPPSP